MRLLVAPKLSRPGLAGARASSCKALSRVKAFDGGEGRQYAQVGLRAGFRPLASLEPATPSTASSSSVVSAAAASIDGGAADLCPVRQDHHLKPPAHHLARESIQHDKVQARVYLARRVHADAESARQNADQGIRPRFPTLEQLPLWGFDGSSTMQAEGHQLRLRARSRSRSIRTPRAATARW